MNPIIFISLTQFAYFTINVYANFLPEFIPKEDSIVLRLSESLSLPKNKIIHKFHAVDLDQDVLTFEIQGKEVIHSYFELNPISSTQANLILKKKLDRETIPEFYFEVALTDRRLSRDKIVKQQVLIIVTDVNDNSPTFKQGHTNFSILENANVPLLVSTFEASDLDSGPNSEIGYSLQLEIEDELLFSLSQKEDGLAYLYLIRKLDYDKKKLFKIKLIAYDKPLQGKRNEVLLEITINVERPKDILVFKEYPKTVIEFGEDVKKGTKIFNVRATATANDDKQILKITYYLSNELEKFEIDQKGTVMTKRCFNCDEKCFIGAYRLEIKAVLKNETKEKANALNLRRESAIFAEIFVVVKIMNVEEPPKFANSSYSGTIQENSLKGSQIIFNDELVPEVFDNDMDGKARINLQVVGAQDIFKVKPDVGYGRLVFQLTVINETKLDYELQKEIKFSLIADDETGRVESVPFTIKLIDMNDNFPQFEMREYKVRMKANAPRGYKVIKLKAIDKDSGVYGTDGLKFTKLVGFGSEAFDLNKDTGLVTVKNGTLEVLDGVTHPILYLIVEVSDNLGNGNRNLTSLTIEIEGNSSFSNSTALILINSPLQNATFIGFFLSGEKSLHFIYASIIIMLILSFCAILIGGGCSRKPCRENEEELEAYYYKNFHFEDDRITWSFGNENIKLGDKAMHLILQITSSSDFCESDC